MAWNNVGVDDEVDKLARRESTVQSDGWRKGTRKDGLR